ncbi:hypothetical protein AB0J55_39735 [Amycolatopsis sp. NPDC049688]|uniref:hypothetical protein n=1 Tax=Amycolatopsis sp. NPDC049688 TaxID=3154733 RepID=UPI00344AA9AA
MKRTLSILFVVFAGLLSSVAVADAAPAHPVTIYAPVGVSSGDSVQALSCSSGNLCVWPVADGSRNRCSWSNADNDWRGGSTVCSWSASPVMASYNHGTSSSYAGVCMYTVANYGGNVAYFLYQGQSASGFPGVVIRSHKWVTTDTCF